MIESDEMQQPHSSTGGNSQESSLIDTLLAVAPSLLNHYHRLLRTNSQIFQTELKIALKSLLIIILSGLMFLVFAIAFWIGLNVLIALGIWAYFPSVLAIIAALVAFNALAIFVNLKLAGALSKNLNLTHTLASLGVESASP